MNPHKQSHTSGALSGVITMILIAAVLSIILLLAAGCTGLRDSMLRPVVEEKVIPETVVTNYVALKTNVVSIPAVVDASGNILTPAATVEKVEVVPLSVPQLITNLAHTLLVTNSWEKDPKVFGTVDAVGGMFPGWGTLASGAFGAFGTLLAAFWRKKAGSQESAAVAVIDGVEELRKALQQTQKGREIDAQFVKLLKDAQEKRGALDAVQELLRIHTGKTIPVDDLAKLTATL